MRRPFFLIAMIFILIQSCYQEVITFDSISDDDYQLPLLLNLDNRACSYDKRNNTLRYSLDISLKDDYSPYVEFQEISNVFFNGVELNNKQTNYLGKIDFDKDYEVIIDAGDQSKTFKLMFTNLPIIQIITPNRICNEPKVPAIMQINCSDCVYAGEYPIGIEYRGQSSLALPKKSMGFSLRNSTNYNERISASLFDLRINNDWILDAMYQDKSNIRASSSFEVWESIVADEKLSIHSKFVEVFINNEHRGLYCLREIFNAESFGIINSNSVAYKSISGLEGATRFETYSDTVSLTYTWDGWEQIYPDSEKKLNWEPLKELRYLAAVSDSNYFCSNVSSIINIDEYIDLYVFMYVSYAHDCLSKNIFLLKNEGEEICFIPWDLDPTWGLWWSGDYISCYGKHISENLFARLMELNPDNFKEQFADRWFELRNTVLAESEIKAIFTKNLNILKTSNIIDLDNELWDTGIDLDEQESLIFTWLENRINYLDRYFSSLKL